ncbi:MAG TPA: hypothetical protein PK668_14905 [Myxococcota bacterium]|nr:hypothetical protein [Myxococcota bacterium]HRY94183.1 hypothetical protein [Myxococcota bacterium]
MAMVSAAACSGSVHGPNQPPQAVAGPDRTVDLGTEVALDGSASFDPDGDRIYFRWSVLAAPPGSLTGGVLIPPDLALSRFVPTAQGRWLLALRVSDGRLSSERDLVLVRVRGEPCQLDPQCDDGVYCNGLEICQHDGGAEGHCAPGSPPDCSLLDGPCVDGLCQETSQACRAVPRAQGVACDDGLYCTEQEVCDAAGQCRGQARICVPSGPCRAVACEEVTDRCLENPAPDATPCDDGQFCTVGDTCQAGQCQGAARDCSAPGSCATGSCDEAGDRCTGDPAPDGDPCDDGDWCTQADACLGGLCQGAPLDCSAAADACNDGACDPATGACLPRPAREGEACDDRLFCTAGERCQQGACLSAQVTDCSAAADACNAGVCDEAGDACLSAPAREGEFCDDGLFCTLGDQCVQGECVGTTPRDCPDGPGACDRGVCDEGAGTCRIEAGGEGDPCEDGDPCTLGDTCQAGACVPGQACPLGCDAQAQPPRCLRLRPSNVDPAWLCQAGAPAFPVLLGDAEIDTDLGTLDGAPHEPFHIQVQPADADGAPPDIAVFVFERVELPAGITLRVVGARALALLACEELILGGALDARAEGWRAGAGGYAGGAGSYWTGASYVAAEDGDGYGAGPGLHGLYQGADPYLQSGGGGGAFGRAGGDGGDGTAPSETTRPGGAGGSACGLTTLSPLLGGSGGGGGGAFNWAGDGGGGGGAIQLVAGERIRVETGAIIHAGGGGGGTSSADNWGAAGGGGAGGGILLEAPVVEVAGLLAANGGGGGGARTDYSDWGLYCPPGTPTGGEDGLPAADTADGGLGCSGAGNRPAGSGGRGGALSGGTEAGVAGENGRTGGGGGGGVGRIRVNTLEDLGFELTGTTSPDCSVAGNACTTGPVDLE